MKIAFLGNFGVPFSTESHHKKVWDKLGHQVVCLQENKTPPEQIVDACHGARLFQATHTHGWAVPGKMDYEEALTKVHAMGVPSFSYHLDVYFGLNRNDHREDRVGRTWEWKVKHFFSTDGGHDDFFRSRGVNHHWLPPGVDEDGCYFGTPQQQYVCDVAFVGSIGYHPEYPFRTRLVEELRARYGQRFRVFQGVRERALNDVYASVKVVVGDHCFAGAPRYWSDRAPETAGRGGFLIYPRTEGLDIPVATYDPQNVTDLCAKVDYFLTHEKEREEIRRECHEYVKANCTYRHRLLKVLQVMGI